MKGKKILVIALIIAVILLIILAIYFSGRTQKACTEEAKICPDGSSVARTGPNCEFAPCPEPLISKEEAIEIAENSVCAGNLTDNVMYNSDTKTWWIDMTLEKEGCSPACVVREESKIVSINWRCTGAIPP